MKLKDLPRKILSKPVQLRNVDSTGLKRSELLHILMRTQKHQKETEYLNHLQVEPTSNMKSMIIKIKKFITELEMLLSKVSLKESFDSNYQMYTSRGDKERNMSIKEYLEKLNLILSL